MHPCRKRIVHFVVKQIPALFAYGNELLYRIIFFFQTHSCHKFLPTSTRNLNSGRSWPPKVFFPQMRGQYTTLAQLTPLRSPKRTVGNPPPDHSSLL